jgi:hypothetical protein
LPARKLQSDRRSAYAMEHRRVRHHVARGLPPELRSPRLSHVESEVSVAYLHRTASGSCATLQVPFSVFEDYDVVNERRAHDLMAEGRQRSTGPGCGRRSTEADIRHETAGPPSTADPVAEMFRFADLKVGRHSRSTLTGMDALPRLRPRQWELLQRFVAIDERLHMQSISEPIAVAFTNGGTVIARPGVADPQIDEGDLFALRTVGASTRSVGTRTWRGSGSASAGSTSQWRMLERPKSRRQRSGSRHTSASGGGSRGGSLKWQGGRPSLSESRSWSGAPRRARGCGP